MIPAIDQAFADYLKVDKGLAINELERSRQELIELTEFAQQRQKSLLSLDSNDLQDYLKLLKNKGLDVKSLSKQLTTLRQVYTFLILKGLLQHDPTANLEIAKSWQSLPKILTTKEIEKLFAQPDDSASGLRDKAMLALLYATGLGIGELLSLKIDDLRVEATQLHTLTKRVKNREINLTPLAQETLRNYLTMRPTLLKGQETKLLFINNQGEAISRQQFWRSLVSYGQKAGLGHITPHMLRPTFASHLLAHGADLSSVQLLLTPGHSAAREVSHNTSERLKNIYDQCHPRAR